MAQKSPIVMIGMGQLGSLFSTGFLRLGHPVYPILRGDRPHAGAQDFEPILVMAAVGEADLSELLGNLPEAWKDRLALLTNELLPVTWQAHAVRTPTVISVQFEKKPGQPVVIDRPSPVFGPHADLIIQVLKTHSIPAVRIESVEAMTQHLVLKNLYILTLNLGGLATRGTAAELLSQHRDLTEQLWAELYNIQQALVEIPLDSKALLDQTMDYLALAPQRQAGRSAGARLQRALGQARSLGIRAPTLETIQQEAEK